MAYNPNNATDVAELKTELTTDPVTMGYDLTKVKHVSTMINEPDDNTSPETIQRDWFDIQMWEILDDDILDNTEYAALAQFDKDKVLAFLSQPQETTFGNYRLMFRNSFGSTSTTYQTNLVGLRTVDASRADALWGYGSNITKDNVIAALES